MLNEDQVGSRLAMTEDNLCATIAKYTHALHVHDVNGWLPIITGSCSSKQVSHGPLPRRFCLLLVVRELTATAKSPFLKEN